LNYSLPKQRRPLSIWASVPERAPRCFIERGYSQIGSLEVLPGLNGQNAGRAGMAFNDLRLNDRLHVQFLPVGGKFGQQ